MRQRDKPDDQLGRIPKRRVDQAAHTGTDVGGDVLGCLTNQPGEGDQRERGKDERYSGWRPNQPEIDADRDERQQKTKRRLAKKGPDDRSQSR